MNSRLLFSLVPLVLIAVLFSSGCGEKAPQVDLDTQIGALSGDADTKIAALSEIARLGPGAAPAVDKVIPLLKDPDEIVRRTAAYALGSIGPAAKAAVPELKSMLNTGDRNQLTAVANALNAIETSTTGGGRIENVSN